MRWVNRALYLRNSKTERKYRSKDPRMERKGMIQRIPKKEGRSKQVRFKKRGGGVKRKEQGGCQ